ncbi:MAG: TonB-dependent receptor [Gammaproteobacteria bacterium]|nr:TonB-dependent receptor [Gammaproteobacteria bacterium]
MDSSFWDLLPNHVLVQVSVHTLRETDHPALNEFDVGSLTTVDAAFSYILKTDPELNFGVRNVLDRDTPNTVRCQLHYDPTR